MRALATLAALTCLLCGCVHDQFDEGRGEVGDFILQQCLALAPATQFVTTSNLPAINAPWRYSKDKDGVVIRLSKESFPAVEIFLLQALGEPRIKPTVTPHGELGVYRLSPKGGALQFLGNAKYTQIIIIRPLTTEEAFTNMIQSISTIQTEKLQKELSAPSATNR